MTQSSSLFKKLALAAVGQALPETSALTATLKATQRGLLLTVVTGVFVAALLLLSLFGFYLFLRAEGVSVMTAIGLLGGLLLLLTIITGLMAERYLSKASEVKQELAPFSGMDQLAAPVEEIVTAFVNGFMNAPKKRDAAVYRAVDKKSHKAGVYNAARAEDDDRDADIFGSDCHVSGDGAHGNGRMRQ